MSSLSARYHWHGHMSRRKAISEMLGAIILLSLVIVAAVLVYQIFIGKANVASSATALSIQSVTISGENGVMTITVQNTGTSVINSINIKVYQSGSTVSISGSLSPSTITPGETASGTFTGNFAPGQQYTVVVTATAAGGSTTTATATVTAS